jgi:hypothetical protein
VICFASFQGTIEVKGIRIISDGYGTDIDGIKPFNSFKGTSIACLAILPQGGIIKFDEDKSSLDKFTDNLGTNLMNDQIPIGSGIGMMSEISSDRKAAMFEINGLNLPDKRATSIKASGHVSLKTATIKKPFKYDNLVLKVGSKFEISGIKFEITRIGKPIWGDGVVSVTFSSNSDISKIASIQFFDPNGEIIKSSSEGSGIQTHDNKKIYEIAYNLQKQPDALNLSIICWEDMQTVKIPFNINASVGL